MTLKDDKEVRTHSTSPKNPAYGCEFCGRRFYKRTDLHSHIEKIHWAKDTDFSPGNKKKRIAITNSKPKHNLEDKSKAKNTNKTDNVCNICEKKFTYKNGLIRHERIHTGEKPYQCNFCDKKFNDRSHAKRHERIHKGEKPYQCSFCDMKFNRISVAKKHELTHDKGQLGDSYGTS